MKEIIEWYEVKKRKPTEAEKVEFAERDLGEVPYLLIGDMPENGEEILIATPYGVSIDVCGIDDDYGFYLEETGDWDDVIAWAYLPKYNKSPELTSDDSKKHAKTHHLKLLEQFADDVLNGRKSFEVRINDRGFQTGDKVRFNVVSDFVNGSKSPIDHPLNSREYEITYILSGWGLEKGVVAFGIKESGE